MLFCVDLEMDGSVMANENTMQSPALPPAGKSSPGSPPSQLFYLGEWFDSAPTEPGMYWFCGDPWFGSMGGDWSGVFSPDVRIYLVELFAISNGVMGKTEGQFFSLVKFDREHRREGWFGKWCRANVPYACDLSDMKHLLPEKKQ